MELERPDAGHGSRQELNRLSRVPIGGRDRAVGTNEHQIERATRPSDLCQLEAADDESGIPKGDPDFRKLRVADGLLEGDRRGVDGERRRSWLEPLLEQASVRIIAVVDK